MYRIIRLFSILLFQSTIISLHGMQTISFKELATFAPNSKEYRQALWYKFVPTIGYHADPRSTILPHTYTLDQLSPGQGRGVTIALLDNGVGPHAHVSFSDKKNCTSRHHPLAAHGTQSYGLLAARTGNAAFDGLIPHATIHMIAVANSKGAMKLEDLIKGLQRALDLKADIVCLPFKAAQDTVHQADQIEKLLNKVPYLVAPSGNDGAAHAYPFIYPHQAWPASCAFIPFDVGSFGRKDNEYFISPFSQFEEKIGPKFVMPGEHILAPTLNKDEDTDSDLYAYVHGTSIAAIVLAGLVGRIVAEYGKDFSRNQIITVCFAAAQRLGSTPDWQTKVGLGTLDARLALFILGALKHIKQLVQNMNYAFDTHFNQLVEALLITLDHSDVPLHATSPEEAYAALAARIKEVLAGNKATPYFAEIRSVLYAADDTLFKTIPKKVSDRIKVCLKANA